ncbi:hypothetical protein PR202_gb27344 [Eleusine coracana subsp. coracana]|uniref:UNC93-like protein 1 n=1 Tax=Eleusine coracana subsp. coracana TaxID=191504 RepID=A0AAV5FU06_ELECO|nr:hypothetical protein PR202_gb27344 [Eleusine coracana subsp. coracana]
MAEEESSSLAKKRVLRFNSPLSQVSLLGLICFCCPGMFNALSGLGGGGQLDHTTGDNANTALYACFAVFGVLGGGAHNILGPRGSQIFPVTAGAILGAGAGFLWAAQGAIMTSYPPPNRRGTYISLFWCVFNLGGVLGGLLPFAFNYNRGNDPASVNDATYIAFIAFMLVGAALTLLVLPPTRIVRDDGTRPTRVTYTSPATELAQILSSFADWKMLLALPAAWASNFFYTYQFNNVNGLLFTVRTEGLNNVFYWGAQMIGSAAIGYFLDFGFAKPQEEGARPFMLYFSYGLLDAMFQSLIYWIIGALANDSQILSRYVGFYKGVQSAGAAVAWQVDTHKTSLVSQLVVNWALMTISYPLLALLVFLAVKDEDSSSVSSVEDGKENNNLSAPTSFH